MKILLISRYVLPQVGGSTLVHGQLCRRIAGITVAAGSFDPEAERAYDAKQPYRTYRSRSLAPVGWEAGRDPLTRALWHGNALWNRLRARRAVWKAARRSGADVCCIGTLPLYWMAGFVRSRLRLPVIFYVHGVMETETPRFYSELRRADGAIGVSRYICERLKKQGVAEDRIELIPNGVDTRRFTPGPKDAAVLERYGLRGKRVLLTVGRFESCKGHATVIRALPRIAAEFPDVAYLVAGSGEGLPDLGLEALARETGVGDRVIFAGELPPEEMCGIYRSCDIFAMPNYTLPNGFTEGFGLVFLEAGACGKPSIAGRDGGAPDAVANGETGLLVNGASAEEVADAALRLLREPDMAARLGAAGRRRAEEMSWEAMAKKFAAFCARTAERGART